MLFIIETFVLHVNIPPRYGCAVGLLPLITGQNFPLRHTHCEWRCTTARNGFSSEVCMLLFLWLYFFRFIFVSNSLLSWQQQSLTGDYNRKMIRFGPNEYFTCILPRNRYSSNWAQLGFCTGTQLSSLDFVPTISIESIGSNCTIITTSIADTMHSVHRMIVIKVNWCIILRCAAKQKALSGVFLFFLSENLQLHLPKLTGVSNEWLKWVSNSFNFLLSGRNSRRIFSLCVNWF